MPFPAATFMNAMLDRQHFVYTDYTKGHENLTSGLVADVLQTDRGMCR
jgi:hypothetical protein